MSLRFSGCVVDSRLQVQDVLVQVVVWQSIKLIYTRLHWLLHVTIPARCWQFKVYSQNSVSPNGLATATLIQKLGLWHCIFVLQWVQWGERFLWSHLCFFHLLACLALRYRPCFYFPHCVVSVVGGSCNSSNRDSAHARLCAQYGRLPWCNTSVQVGFLVGFGKFHKLTQNVLLPQYFFSAAHPKCMKVHFFHFHFFVIPSFSPPFCYRWSVLCPLLLLLLHASLVKY